jgi:hypothetical protein
MDIVWGLVAVGALSEPLPLATLARSVLLWCGAGTRARHGAARE